MCTKKLMIMKVHDILKLYSITLEELVSRKITRSMNNPVADYAEYLVCHALKLERAMPSEKGYDAKDKRGKKYEIKARRETEKSKPTRYSAIRNLDRKHFDYLVAIIFSKDFYVEKAILLTWNAVKKRSTPQLHKIRRISG